MKNRLLSILFVLLAGTGAVFAQSEVTPPAFNGAVIRVFMTRMAATVEKIAIEQQIPADSISPVVGIALQIDKAGNVAEWRYMDNTQEGRDHAEFAPATAAGRWRRRTTVWAERGVPRRWPTEVRFPTPRG